MKRGALERTLRGLWTCWWGILIGMPLGPLFAEVEVRRAFPQTFIPGAAAAESSVVRSTETPPPLRSPPPESSETIRLRPLADSVTKVQLEGANSLYVRKMYDLAIPEYEKFLHTYPRGEGRDAALFRWAESNRFLGRHERARDGYLQLIQEFPTGEFTGSAAYRLGDFFFSVQNYSGALTQFQLAAANAKEEGVRLSALFYQARCWEALHQRSQAVGIYKQLAPLDSPFREYCFMALAQEDADAGRQQDALDKFDRVAQMSRDPATQAEANVRGGAIAIALNQAESALGRFRRATTIAAAPVWQSAAWLGLLQVYYQTGKYDRVVANKEKMVLSEDAQPEGLLLIGNSYRQLGRFKEAVQSYDELVQKFPDSSQVDEARFQRLVALYSLEDPRLSDAMNAFQTADPHRRSQASLLRAEVLFQKKRFAEAAPLFQNAWKANLPVNLKANALYKLGWCYAHSGRMKDAIFAYSQFLENYPENSLIPSAWLQRGIARQQNQETNAALRDYDTLIAHFPQSREREVALLQRALLLGAQDDKTRMVQTFQRLLSDYPKSAAAAQANFWLGWAAFENKDYTGAINYLNRARMLDHAKYQKRVAFRILLANYYLKNWKVASREAVNIKLEEIPEEISRWLGIEAFQNNQFSDAERYLHPLLKNPDALTPDGYLALAEAQLKLRKYSATLVTIESYLAIARDPISRAQGLFMKVQALKGEGKVEDALRLTHEVQLLQPEGSLNARARLMAGDLQMAKQDYSEAGRDYTAVALLYDDPKLTPQALKGAIRAYRQANNLHDEQKALEQLKKRFPQESVP